MMELARRGRGLRGECRGEERDGSEECVADAHAEIESEG
jgi:hypothetical protein